MPRTTNLTIEGLLPACKSQSTVDITLRDDSILYFCTGGAELDLGSNIYEPFLLRIGELKETLGQPTNRVAVKVSNVDGQFGLNVASVSRKMELSEIVIKRLYQDEFDPGVYQWIHIFSGKCVNSEVYEAFVSFDVISDMSAAGTCIASETLSPNNGWVFPETPEQSPPGSGGNPLPTFPCFPAGTLIFTPDGAKRIEDFEAGDSVYSFNEETKEIFADRVVEVLTHNAKGYFEFNDSLKVTPEHRFLTADGWLAADNFEIGKTLVWQFESGKWQLVLIEKVKWLSVADEVFNLHVERNHNYLAGGFAAHNAKDPRDL